MKPSGQEKTLIELTPVVAIFSSQTWGGVKERQKAI